MEIKFVLARIIIVRVSLSTTLPMVTSSVNIISIVFVLMLYFLGS